MHKWEPVYDKLFMKCLWRDVGIVRLILAQKVIAIKCRTKFVFDVPVWRSVGVSTVGLWTCRRVDFRCVDLSACRPVLTFGVSTCRCVDLSATDVTAIDLSVYLLLTILFGW